MLIGLRVSLNGTDMDSPFVGKGTGAHIGLVLVGCKVCYLVNVSCSTGELFEVFSCTAFKAHLQDKGRNYGTKVGVSASFAKAVHGALHLAYPGSYRKNRICYSHLRVIVTMDAQPCILAQLPLHLFYYLHDLRGHGAAVGVAKDEALRPGIPCLLEGGYCIIPVCLEAVEKMLCIVKKAFHPGFQVLQGIFDDFQVSLKAYSQGISNMYVPALSKNGHCRGT